MTIYHSQSVALLAILRDRIAKEGPTDEIAADIRETERRMWELFDRARERRNTAACASPEQANKCSGCGCWKVA